MQRDFHHTVIYTLCRLAGMKSKDSEIVAYCSQYVDHASYGHALKFKEGGAFWQTRTAHHMLSRKLYDVSDAFNVWLPFHFLPQGEGSDMHEALITCSEGKSLNLLKEVVIKNGNKSYGLHWLGIFLHVYADSYSHQDFKGYYDPHNQIKLVSGREVKTKSQLLREYILEKLSFLAPIGHGQALQNPDIPFAIWSYQRADGEIIKVNNLKERFIPALDSIYNFIVQFLKKNPRYNNDVVDDSIYNLNRKKIINLLNRKVSSRRRHQLWLDRIRNNNFELQDFDDIDRNLNYDRKEWFKKAVLAVKARGLKERAENITYNFYKFEKKKNFRDSNWVKFMRAAAIHKYRILHTILPECGLSVG